jgi:hypothetical protein
MTPNSPNSRLARLGAVVVGGGFAVFILGLFPGLVGLDFTPGIGLLQIGVFLAGLSLMTLGSYLYLSATRHRARPWRLRNDIGVRLMATGLVMAFASGFADVLGIGSNYGHPVFGPLKAAGVGLSIFIIIVGTWLYAS